VTARAENGDAILERRDPSAIHFLGAVHSPPRFDDRLSVPGIGCHLRTERYSRDFREVTCDECRMSPAFQVARRGRADRARVRLVVIEAEGVSLSIAKAVLSGS
jgi:hypothetical protein